MSLDFTSEKAIFLQLAEQIETDILRSILEEDEQCPSTNELARLHGINPNTAAKALTLLYNDEILYKKRGVGMFVSRGAMEKILKKRRESFIASYVKPLLWEAAALGIEKNEVIHIIEGEKE